MEPLDSSATNRVFWSYPFDAAIQSRDSTTALVYERLGTKGLIVREGRVVREVNRSYYYAHAYEYPAAIGTIPDGMEVIAHCPNEYNIIEIEELLSGRKLTERSSNNASDFFHSRLAFSASGDYLLSAGWLWHPWSDVRLFDVQYALKDPIQLDKNPNGFFVSPEEIGSEAEVTNAVFFAYNQLVLEVVNVKDERQVGVYDCERMQLINTVDVQFELGICATLGEFVFGLYGHPRIINPITGEVVCEWPEFLTGKQNSSIVTSEDLPPPYAVDSDGMRFAVVANDNIWVVELEVV